MCKSRNEIHIKNEFINQTTKFVKISWQNPWYSISYELLKYYTKPHLNQQ